MSRYETHEHSYTSGPEARRARKPGEPHLVHSHEGGDVPHSHPETGPGRYGRNRLTRKPAGPQLPYVERERRTFHVFFLDEYTDGHAAAGISRERWERERAAFLAEARAPAVERMATDFRLTPVYALIGGEDSRG